MRQGGDLHQVMRGVQNRLSAIPALQRQRALKGLVTYWATTYGLADIETLSAHLGVKVETHIDKMSSEVSAQSVTPWVSSDKSTTLAAPEVMELVEIMRAVGIASTPSDAIVQLRDTLTQVYSLLHEASGKKRFQDYTLLQLAQIAAQRVIDNEQALNAAAQESFDRILSSVDPETAKVTVSQSAMKVGPFHKAALYDAITEKYKQLRTYHERGRLVRDFRAMYGSRLSQSRKEMQKNGSDE